MKELVEGIEKQISTDKDVISVLPRNGIKAIKTLLETINEMIAKYEKLNEKLLADIEERYNKLTSVEANPKISELEAEIEKYVSAEKILDNRTPFEKMGLDKICYNVNGYYKSENYKKMYLELISKDVSELSEAEKAEKDEYIEKLNSNLKEYSKFVAYKFISDEVLKIREEELKRIEADKDKKVKKTQYDILKENVKKLTVEIFKINGKIEKSEKGRTIQKVICK